VEPVREGEDPSTLADIQARFAGFADMAERRLPLYHRLASATAADPEVAGRLLLAHPDQRQPMLMLAAVHDALLAGLDDPLRQWYPSVVGQPKSVGIGADDPWPHFRRLVLEDQEIEERLRTRSTQTNEVGRSAVLLPALSATATAAPGAPPHGARPLGLVELGASAGLNLLFDRYGYRYEPGRGADHPVIELHTEAPLVLGCTTRGEHPPPVPDAMPHISSRVGIDLSPVDLHHRAQSRWLVACQWPDQPERVHRARAAIALAHADPPRVIEGDMVELVAEQVAHVPAHALPVVFATWALAYLPAERQAALLAELGRVAADTGRELSLLFAELPDEVPGLPIPARPDGIDQPNHTALVRVDWWGGERTAARLADVHPHGTWIEWLA
jgi:hypothetical protein